jgi:hypothetical protein
LRFGGIVGKSINRITIASLLIALAASLCFFLLSGFPWASLEVRMTSTVSSGAQVFFDMGRGENEQDSGSTTLAPSAVPQTYRFRVPPGYMLLHLRFDALSDPGTVRVFSAKLINSKGTVLRQFSHGDFAARNQFVETASDPASSTFETTATSPGQILDPMLTIRLDQPLPIGSRFGRVLAALVVFCLAFPSAAVLLRWFPRDADRQYRLAVKLAVLFHIVHAMALPAFFSYDSMQYAHLARVLFSPSFPADWDLQRAPLFPFVLHLSFFLGGDQPQAAILPGLLAGLSGVLLLGSVAKRIVGGTYAAVVILVLSAYPYLVSYEHIPLTEIGTFFFLALLVWTLLAVSRISTDRRLSYSIPVATALVLVLGFYHRPTVIYLSPFVSVLYILLLANPECRAASPAQFWRALKRQPRSIVVRALVLVILPWLLAYPWTRIAAQRIGETKNRVLGYGMAMQAVIPPGDPRLGSLAAPYSRAIAEANSDGRFRTDGLPLATNRDTILGIGEIVNQVGPAAIIMDYPLRYLRGYIRTLIVYLGYPRFPPGSESEPFSIGVFIQWPPSYTLAKSLGWHEVEAFAPPSYGGGAALGSTLHRLSPFYTWLVLCSTLASLLWMIASVWNGNAVAMTMVGVPLGYLVLHALTLMSVNRYSFPTYPLFLACAICAAKPAGQFVVRRFRLRSTQNTPDSSSISHPRSVVYRCSKTARPHPATSALSWPSSSSRRTAEANSPGLSAAM